MMRHGKRIARLGRPQDQRKALVRSLTTEVLRHGRITTTLVRTPSASPYLAQHFLFPGDTALLWSHSCSAIQVKAKAIRKYVDKMIQLAKRGDLHARRQVRQTSSQSSLVMPTHHAPPRLKPLYFAPR